MRKLIKQKKSPYIPIAKARGFTATFGKFFLDNPDIEKKKNCGIQYLKLFVEKNLKNDEKAVIQEKLKDVRNKIKEGKKIAKKIQSMRNSLIAHYDIEKIEYVKQIRMNIEEFETIFNLSCEILELLSLYYFHFEENNSYDKIGRASCRERV